MSFAIMLWSAVIFAAGLLERMALYRTRIRRFHESEKQMNLQGGNLREITSEKHIRMRFRYILEQVPDDRRDVLIIGSGDASLEKMLRRHKPRAHITSIETNDSYRDDIEPFTDTLIIDDYLTHDFTDTYDVIISVDVIEHIEDTDTFLRKSHRILRPEGMFLLQTPNLASWHGRLCLLFGFLPEALEVSNRKSFFGKFGFFRHEDAIHHVRVFTCRALYEMCRYYGFAITDAAGIDYRIPRFFRHLPSLSGSVCLVCAKSPSDDSRE